MIQIIYLVSMQFFYPSMINYNPTTSVYAEISNKLYLIFFQSLYCISFLLQYIWFTLFTSFKLNWNFLNNLYTYSKWPSSGQSDFPVNNFIAWKWSRFWHLEYAINKFKFILLSLNIYTCLWHTYKGKHTMTQVGKIPQCIHDRLKMSTWNGN